MQRTDSLEKTLMLGKIEDRRRRGWQKMRCLDVRARQWKGWDPKNWCFRTVVLEKTLESPLDCKEIQPVHTKGNQYWIFIGRTDADAETPILWPRNVKNWLIGKDWLGNDWRETLKEGGDGDDREWVGWMASTTWGTWVWVSSRSWWWTGKPGMLQSMGSQSRTWLSDWTELNWAELNLGGWGVGFS